MTMIETMAVGIPQVTTEVGELGPTLREADAGLTVPVEDLDAFHVACRAVLSDPDLHARLRDGALAAVDEFDATRMVDRYAALFEAAISGARASRRARRSAPSRRADVGSPTTGSSSRTTASVPTWQVDTSVTPERLREQLLLLQSKGYRGVTLSEALRTPKRRKVMVATFDDAHISVYTLAKPILEELGVPGTIFVPTDYPDSGRRMAWKGYDMWVGTPHEQELACMSRTSCARSRTPGWEIGSHTCAHPA